MMMKPGSLFIFICLTLFSNVSSYAISPFGGAITAGSGLSGRAVAEEVEGASQNPALVAFSKGYHLRLTGLRGDNQIGQSAFRVSILDNMPDTALPASILYSEFRNQQNFTERDLLINFGNLIGEKSALGFAVGYRTIPGLDIGNPLARERSQVYAMIGAQHYFSEELGIAGTFETNNYGVGISYIHRRLIRLRLDYTHSTLGRVGGRSNFASFGGETFINQWLVLRLGATQAVRDEVQSTWGIGLMGPRLKINYAYAPFNFFRSNEYAHWLDFSMPVW